MEKRSSPLQPILHLMDFLVFFTGTRCGPSTNLFLMGSRGKSLRVHACWPIPMDKLILVTGSTGYIASRLIPRLLDSGYRVRCLARNPLRLKGRSWFQEVEVVQGDGTV